VLHPIMVFEISTWWRDKSARSSDSTLRLDFCFMEKKLQFHINTGTGMSEGRQVSNDLSILRGCSCRRSGRSHHKPQRDLLISGRYTKYFHPCPTWSGNPPRYTHSPPSGGGKFQTSLPMLWLWPYLRDTRWWRSKLCNIG
jgi:hypothetical protein